MDAPAPAGADEPAGFADLGAGKARSYATTAGDMPTPAEAARGGAPGGKHSYAAAAAAGRDDDTIRKDQ